jgi:P-type Cu+ transporter
MESYSKAKTADAVTALASLRPAEALLVVTRNSGSQDDFHSPESDLEKGGVNGGDLDSSGYTVKKVDVNLLEVGDIVRVQSGSTPPADGIILCGVNSAFDESSLTGESKLVRKSIGDEVFLSTINRSNVVDIRVTEVGGGTM